MGFSRLHKRIFAVCIAIFMFVGEFGNLPPSSALAKQTDVVQSVENAANSNIPAPKTEESLPIGDSASDQTEVEKSDDNTANSNIPAQNTQVSVAVPTVEQVTLPAGGVTSNQVDNENNVENPINSNIPVSQTQESVVVPAGEDEPEVEKELNKDAIISAKVLSDTSEDENEETIENIELQELGDFDIPFVEGPNGAGTEFVIEPGTEKHLSFTIPEEGFSPGSYVIAIDTVAGSEFNFSCSVTDSEANELAKSYYYYSEYNSSRNIYFTLKKPGAYQFNVFDVYFNNEDNQNATLSAKVYKTIEPPAFGVTQESFTEPFYLTFTDIPEGYKVYYYIFDYSQSKGEEPQDTLYDPQKLDKINTECNVYAYCLAEGENGTLTSETVYQNYYPDIERAACSALYPNNIIESGGSITLTTEDPTLEIYYILDSEWMRCSSNYIKENGTLYTGPITVEGQENDHYYLYFVTVNSNGVLSAPDCADFGIGTPPPPVPDFSPDEPDCGTIYSPSVWESPKTVTVASRPDTNICYRLNQYGMQIEAGMEGVYTTSSNTLTLDVDHDMYVEACAYDEEKNVYSSNLGRAYVIEEPKTLTVTQSGETSVEGKIFTGYDESFIINVQQAGAYKITIERPELSWWYDYSLPVYLYDSDDNVLVALDDSDSQKRNTLNIERNLEVGTYKLVLAEDQSGRSWMQSYKLTISKGMEPPQFSVPGGIYGEEFDLVLSHSEPDCDIYYRMDYGEYVKYTGPITISKTTSIYAYASIGGVNSNTVYAYYRIDTAPPVLESYGRFIIGEKGGISSSTVLTGQVPIRAVNIFDYNSGIDYVDYYLSVNGGAYNKIGSAPWGTDFVWDTTNVTESNEGSVSVRLLPIAYDKAGNASAKESDLNSEYDSQYSPIFHINNAPCAPVDSLTYNEGVGSIKLSWTREPELKSGDMILIYRAETEGELSQNLIKEIYYYYKEYSDYFLTKESVSAAYYYGASVRDARGVESAMKIIGPVSPLEDTNGPEISVAGVEENGYKNSGSIIINSSDETAVSSISAKITGSDGTEIIPSGSPWTFEPYRGGDNSGRISEDEFAALSDGAYTLFATATDFFDNSSSMTLHFIKDSIAPQAPVLTASSIPGQIDLRWTASADEDVVGYNILYSEREDGTFSSLNYSLLTERSFTYPNNGSGYIEPGAAYWFKVQAVDRAGNIGETAPVKGTAGKYNPKIRLINENPRLGDNIQIAFSGFKSGEYVYFYLDRNEEPFTYAYIYDPSEESTATMNADLSLRGVHTIRAVGDNSGAVAQIRFTISDLSASVILTPAIVTGKNNFNVKLDGFPTGKPIYFYLDPVDSSTDSDVPYTYFYENDDYNSVDLYLSSFNNPSPGAYVLRAVEPVSGLSAFATLTVAEPEVSLRYEQEKPSAGEYVQFYAAGFDSADVDLYINGELVATVSRAYYQTEHSFYVLIPEVYKDVDAVLATAVQTSTGKEASVKVALNKLSAHINISKGSVGFESFTIEGSGFENYEEVKLYIDGLEKSSATHYDDFVSFTYNFGYDTEPGRHGIELRGEESGLTAIGSILFTDSVQTLILSDSPTLYKPLTIYAGGFGSGERISFSINDEISGNEYADAKGNASFTVDSLKYSPANGSYTFTAKGESSNRVAFYGISTESGGDLKLSYEGNIRSGSTVSFAVTNLDAGENADVYVKNRKETTIVADGSGRAVAQFVVPKGYTGSIPVTVHGKASQKWGTVSVPVTGFNPTVTLTPELPAAGSVIIAEVAGYMPGATLHLKFDDYNSANDAVVSQDGTASLNYTIPANMATGEHTVSVYDSVTGTLIKRSVNVAPSSLTLICPKTALPGDAISLGASGLLSGEVLRVSVNGTSVGGNLIEAGGTATTTYTLPHNAASGNYKVVFAFEKMAFTQMAVISVIAPVASVQAVMDEKNAAITIHAQYFMPNEPLSVYFDNREINDSLESYTANAEGILDVLYTLPVNTFAGDHKVDLLGRNSYRIASTVVNVKETGPIISISGGFSEGKAGDTLSFEGVNFTPLGQYDLYFESELLSKDANVDENGEISGTFTLPGGFADGRYRLIANDKSGGKTALCYIRIDTTPPGAPSLSLFARKQSIVLSWDAPADEDVASYSVYCKPEGNEGYIKLAEIDGAVTTWTHDMRNSDCPITVGKRYEYIVRATDRLGNEGEGSAVISAVLADGTDAPVITGAVATTGSSIRINNEYLSTIKGKENEFYVSVSDDQQISKIEITAAPENGEFLLVGSTVPSYSNNNGGNSEYRATLTVDTTVFSDGIHTFRFTAFDSSGNIGSIERRYYVDNTPPPPVTGLKVVGTSNSVFVSWSWTADATGEVPERYNVYYSTDKNFETYDYTSVYTYEGTKSYTIRSLKPDTLYYIRVTALDIAGNESTWAEGNATPILDVEKPVITQITPDEQRLGKNVYFWIEATDNSEVNLNSARAEINAGENGSFIPFGSYSYGAIRADNLNYNGTYRIRFYISDIAGNESDAYEITREIDTSVTIVTGLTASPAAGGIKLTWDRSPDKDLSYYYLYRSEGGDFELINYFSPLKITSGDTVTWIDYSTGDGITYTYKIVAVDDVYNRSSIDDTTAAESHKGSYDTTITLNPSTDVKPGMIIHISAEGFRGGESVTGYIDSIDEYIFWADADDNGNVSVDWSYVKATEVGSHIIRIKGGYSAAEASASFTCKPVQLPAPTALESTAGIMEISLSWDGVENASYYRVYRAEGAAAEELLADRVYGRNYTDRNLSMTGDVGNIYTYTVAAVDRYGNEGQHSENTVNRPESDLTDPEIDVFTFQRTGSVLRLVAEVSDDLRLGRVIFKYKPAESPDSSYIVIAETPISGSQKKATVNSTFDTSSLPDGSYTLLAQAVDSAGRISVPVTKTLTISSEAPKAPEELTAEAGQMRITLSWKEPTDQNVKIARYNIYRKSGDSGYVFISSTTLTSFTDLNVNSNETYIYQVTCVSDAETEGPAVRLSDRISPQNDTVAPEISGFIIPDGTRLAGSISVAVTVTDNVAVDHVDFFLISGAEEAKIGSSPTGSIMVNTAEYIKEGTLSFKAKVYDQAGNSSEASVSYQIDNAAPAAPVLSVSSGELSVTLKWTMTSVPRDILKYNVYEYIADGDKYRLIGETASSVFVYNTKLSGSYCVSAVDDLGNESLYSNIESCTPGVDSTAPTINGFISNDVVKSEATLTIKAFDNTAIASYLIEYRPLTTDDITGAVVPKEGENAPWYVLSTGSWDELKNKDDLSDVKLFSWDTLAVIGTEDGPEAKFPDGLYAFVLTLTDTAGNKTTSEIRLNIGNDPPTAPEGFRVDSGEWKLIVSWKPAPGNDASAYALYRKVNDGDYELLAYTTSNVYVDQGLNPVNQYFYKVAMENDLGKLGPTTEDYSEGILPPGVKTRPEAETSLPVIVAMSPAQGSRFNAGLNIELQIADNVSLSTVELWKAYIGTSSASQIPEDAVYESFAVIDATDLTRELVNTSDKDILGTELFVVKKTVDTSSWEQGNYAIKAVVRNMGSEPSVQVKTYFKDSTPPPQPTLTVSDPHSGGTVNLSWTGSGADVAYYKVLRTEDPEAGAEDCALIATPLSPVYTDMGLTDGTVYYYYIITVDNAGNASEASKRQSITPTAVSDLGVYSVYASPATLAAGRSNTIRASLRNNGNAAADGFVKFYYGDLEIGSAMIQLAANTGGEVSIEWDTPADLPVRVDIKAVVTNVQETDATDENNSFTASDIKVNTPPVAKILLPALSDGESYNSGESLSFSASGSADPDGSIVQYRWDFGNGKKGDYATNSVTYTMPGRYTVTLTVTDDCGVKTEASQVITVGDRRPDLFVESVRWSPSDPKEGDMVTITATIGNKGLGDATLGFLTGFYIDNRYMGYSKTDEVLRRSNRVAFYVDGISVDVDDRLTIVQGYETDLIGYINNLSVVSAALDGITVSGLPDGLSYEITDAPKGTLDASSGAALVIRFTASAQLAPGEYNVTVSVGESRREVTVTCQKATAVARINVIGNTEAENEDVETQSITMSLRQGETASSVIRLTNIGTAPITGVSASVDLPFISLQNVNSEAVIMPVNRGYSIRDPKGSLSIVAIASPSDYSLTGVYDGKITITSPSLSAPVIVPVKISVGAGQVGTTVFEVRNQDNTLLSGAKVTLIGLDEQLDPVRFDVLTGDGDKAPLGEATFENIPAGNYTLKVSADSHSALETAVSIAAVIDRTPRIVKLSRQLFTFSVDEDTISEMRNSSAATPNYNNVVFKAGELASSAEPQLMPNFVADEKEFYYQSGKLFSKLSFMDPKDSGAAIDNITVRIADADSRIPAGAIAFGSGDTLTPVKKMGRLAPGDVFDIVWNLDIDRFFSIAEVSETETEGQYSVHFAEDVTREMIDAYIAANDPAGSGLVKEISFDSTTNTGIYQAESAPSDRVPMYYGNKPYSFDFTIVASGVRTDTSELVETKVPVRLHYVAPDYYARAGESDSLYDDDGNYKGEQYMDIYDIHPDIEQKVAVSPAFAPASGRVSEMRYSTGFLHDIQANTPNLPDDTEDVSIDLGFSGDVGYEGQVTTLSMKLKNPSPMHPMENLQVKLVLTDAPYDSNGNIQAGGTVLFPNVNVYVGNDKLHEEDGVVGGTLGTGDEALIEYSFRLDKLMRSFESLSSFDETLAEYLKDTRQINKVYARIEGSFVLGGKEHSFVSGVREYEIKEQPKLYISYDLKDRGYGNYSLTATVTNLGSGAANNVILGIPAIPNTGFDMKITGVSSTRGIVVLGTSVTFDRVEISVLQPGDTAIINYELAVIGSLTEAQKISLGKLAALPSIPIKSDTGVGIVMAPMKMEAMRSQSTLDNIDSIIEELGFLANNIKILTNKTASELGRSLSDFYDYSNSLQEAFLVGEVYSFLANIVGYVAAVKDLCELPGKVTTLANKFKNIKFDDVKVKTLGLLNSSYDEAYGTFQKLIKKDIGWTFDYLPKDVSYWYDTYSDIAARAEAASASDDTREAFREYLGATKAAAELLAEATSAINTAMKTESPTERAENAKLARVNMEEAAALIKEAKAIRAEGMGLYNDSISDISGSEGLNGLVVDMLRTEMFAYIAEAESMLEPQITAVAAALAQLAGLEDFEKQVGVLISSSSEIYDMLKDDERLAEDTKGLVYAANSIFDDIGYDVNASAEKKLNSLRLGRKALMYSEVLLAARPVVWFSSWFKMIDDAHFNSVQESTPDMVRFVGRIYENYVMNGHGVREIAEEILIEIFGSAPPAYDWFIKEFENNFPGDDDVQEIRRYIATEVVKIAPRELVNEGLFKKSVESLVYSGMSDYKMIIEAASASAGGIRTNVYKIQNTTDDTIREIIGMLEKYKKDPQMLTGYYPSAQLLDYVRNLNASISAMVKYPDDTLIEPGRVGRYRSLWTYSGEGLDLNVKETTLGEIYSAQMLVDTLLSEGYSNVANRYNLNFLKWMEGFTSIAGNMVGILSSSPVGGVVSSMIGAAGKLLDSSVYSSAMDTVDNANLYNLSRATADLAITTNMMLSKEATIANDIYSVFDTMEKWRKVDPELPLEIVTADVADLVVADDIVFAEATAALTVLNNHTGSVTIAPTVEIYDSYGMVNTVSMGQKTIAPGEEGQFVSNICVPINMLRDMGGYTAVFTFAASEAETMTIAPTFGPYVVPLIFVTSKTAVF